MVGSITLASEVSLLLLVPSSTTQTQLKCAKTIVRHPVSAIDLQNKKVLSVIPVSQTVQRNATSVDDRWVFTVDQTKPRLAVIDTQTDTVKTCVPLQDANRLPSEEQCRPGQ
jgi:hypothetical protein